MEKLKVLHISETFIGGVYTHLRQLSNYSAHDSEIDSYIIYSGEREETNESNFAKDFPAQVKLIPISMAREISFSRDITALYKIIREIRKIKPDIIHLHSSKAGILGRIAQIFLFKRKVLFYSPHGFSFLRTDISNTKKKLYRAIEKIFQTLFKAVTIACGDTEYIIAKGLSKSSLVRNGIDITEVREHCHSHQNEIFTVGIVGRITFARNPELFNKIALRFPSYRFLWIGDGELKHLLSAPNIEITGWIGDREKLLRELNNLDVYIQTSLWEGLPMSVLEAMAMEKPVLATNVIGNKDVVCPEKTGYLFDNIEALDSYFQLLEDEKQRAFLGKNALQRCQELFDVRENIGRLLLIYKSAAQVNR